MLRLANEDASKSRFRILAWLSQIPLQPLSWLWQQCLLRKVASKIVQSIGWTQPLSVLIWRLSLNFKAAGMILNSISLLHKVPLKQYQVDLHRHTKAFLQVPHNLLHWKQDMFQCIQTSVLQKSHKHFTFIPKKLNKCNQHTLPQFSTCSQKKNKVQVLCPHARRRATASKASDHSLYCQDQRHGLHRGGGKWLSKSNTTKKNYRNRCFSSRLGKFRALFWCGPTCRA